MHLNLANYQRLDLDRPRIVGILNVTPDSFSDGGLYADVNHAVRRAAEMVAQGADVIDIGGESTRPGSQRTGADEQLRRVLPIIRRLTAELPGVPGAPLSIDTTLAAVASAAIDAGASIINDTSAGLDDPTMLPLAAARRVPIILMHRQGEPATMQNNPQYRDVVTEVADFLRQRAEAAIAAGVPRESIILDPGIGFGKTAEHNWTLLANLNRFVALGFPVMLGTSRKKFLGDLVNSADSRDRAPATAATTALAVAAGVKLFRVHDIPLNRQAADVAWAMRQRGIFKTV